MARAPNRLATATSPYLLQHAGNPVDWYPWGEEALGRARALDQPILLSIGYSACHWCHVMAHESFENEAIAALMNAHFVNIKVDREERPDLDDIYMAATMAMNHGQGGWPMTVFLTPDQRPFFAGTYFPPDDRHGRPGFPAILGRIAELWRDNRAALERVGGELVTHLAQMSEPAPGAIDVPAVRRRLTAQLATTFDAAWGGFGRAPKFPPSTLVRLLLREHHADGDAHALTMARRTLDGMAHGGMYDQVAGGFCRYSTDDEWLVPHFEKMLYDNALLARAYLEGFQATGNPFYRQVATEVLDYVLREMTAPEGGFYSATDADSEGEEGKFFVWTPAEVRAVLGDEAAPLAMAWFDISEDGNWEGRNIPRTPRSLAEVAARFGLAEEEARAPDRGGAGRALRGAADARPAGARRQGAHRVERPDDRRDGGRGAGARRRPLSGGGDGARRTSAWPGCARPTAGSSAPGGGGTAHLAAYLEDYACLGDGLLDLYEAGGDARYLDEARGLAERIIAEFAAEGGGFFSTAAGHEALLVRHREGHDGAVPAANAVAAQLLARLAVHLDRDDFRRAARARHRRLGRRGRPRATRLRAEPARAGVPPGRAGRAGLRRPADGPGARRAPRARWRAISSRTASSGITTRPSARPRCPSWRARRSCEAAPRCTFAGTSPADSRSSSPARSRPRSRRRAGRSILPHSGDRMHSRRPHCPARGPPRAPARRAGRGPASRGLPQMGGDDPHARRRATPHRLRGADRHHRARADPHGAHAVRHRGMGRGAPVRDRLRRVPPRRIRVRAAGHPGPLRLRGDVHDEPASRRPG